jgi:hypothetical protein
MTIRLPSEIEVRAAMDQILEHSKHTGRRPTIADVERKLGIAHATFCRHFTALTDTYSSHAPPNCGKGRSTRQAPRPRRSSRRRRGSARRTPTSAS